MSAHRLKRPRLERDRPIRSWATLFPTAADGRAAAASQSNGEGEAEHATPADAPLPSDGAPGSVPLGDMVERGYRVIDDYIRQGQVMAQGFSPAAWGRPERTEPTQDVQELAQRVMRYGWDFAGLWFEMWSRMSENLGPVPPPPPPPGANAGAAQPPAAGQSGTPAKTASSAPSLQLTVSVVCERRTTVCFELRPGASRALVIHPLRAEGTDAPPIRDVTIDFAAGDEVATLEVVVPAEQPPGVYNGLIVDASSSLPRGTLSLTVHAKLQD
jgi:hypothetical protein